MGRPLFSSRPEPAVRVEPEPQHPTIQKWSYWNAFDPDSDEFFENDDAVYEAFIDPADRIQIPRDPPVPRTVVDVDISSSSEASSSGRGTPMEVEDTEDPEARTRFGRTTTGGIRVRSRTAALDAALDAVPRENPVLRYLSTLDEAPSSPQTEPETREAPEARPVIRERVVTYLDLPQEQSRTPSPEPDMRALRSFPATPVRPSTPPAQMTPLFAPSPPPSVTPRLYNWSTLTASATPHPASPLTNRDARMSVAHILTPALVPVHRAA